MKILPGFERYVRPIKNKSQKKQVRFLKVGEMWFLPERDRKKIYQIIYGQRKRYNTEFSFMPIKNGTVLLREK